MLQNAIAEIYKILVTQNPTAYANMQSLEPSMHIEGYVLFFEIWEGTLVVADITGLPTENINCSPHFFGFHVHDKDVHYNPEQCLHPSHAGDMPPLLGKNGFAWQMFYTGYFKPSEIIGKTAVIHSHQDDFTSQPSGNSGNMIAVGLIQPYQQT